LGAPTEAWFCALLNEPLSDIAGPDDLRLLHCEHTARYPFLLQSTASDGELGRYDILFAFPGKSLHFDGSIGGSRETDAASFLDALDEWWSDHRVAAVDSALPFHGGWFLYLGYELGGDIETALDLRDDPVLPTAFAVRCPSALIFDHEADRCYLVSESKASIDKALLHSDIRALPRKARHARVNIRSVEEQEPSHFIDAVARAKDYIGAGDIYQANLSREWTARINDGIGSGEIYESLCSANPGPFAGIARWGNTEIISSSPERLLSIRDGIASTRPIAGTRPRSDDDSMDNSLSTELFSHPKERAEHVMLIDLERNDLGRICEAGSVEVNEMMVLESYAHVHHIVSNVRGRLRQDVTPGQAIAAVFPGGTITGCPKIRCMEIIDELEEGPRGAYTGSFGYLNRDGSMDLNILIRTMVRQGDALTFRAGSGIVADSDPDAELQETRAKAEGLLRALQA